MKAWLRRWIALFLPNSIVFNHKKGKSVGWRDGTDNLSRRFYVYTLAYPDGMVFSVGKGQGTRMCEHLGGARNGRASLGCHIIRQIWEKGQEPLIPTGASFTTGAASLRFAF